MSAQQRLLLATVISMVFFIGYSFFFAPERPVNVDNNSSQTTAVQQENSQYSAPNVSSATPNSAPSITPSVNVGKNEELSAISVISTPDFKLTIDKFGRISSKTLLADKYKSEGGVSAQLVTPFTPKPLEIRFQDQKLNDEAFKTHYIADRTEVSLINGSQKVVLTQKLTGVTVTKEITFYRDGHYDLAVNLSEPKQFFLSNGMRPAVDEFGFVVQGSMVKTGNDQITIVEDGDAQGTAVFRDVLFASSFDRYYASLFYGLDRNINVVIESDRQENPMIFIEAMNSISLKGYLGPRDFKVLESLDPELTNAIEYGWFTFIAKPIYLVLQWLHDYTGNWGWAIVLLTLIIRFILYPLTYKGMVSMQKLKDIAPDIKELQRKHKGNPQQMQAKMMELYKNKGANPMGGCLPLLLQIPIFFAIYRVLLNSVELQGEGWILWVEDLAKMDPYFILPILMGGTMYLQQHITPSNFTDPMQEKIFKFLPIIFTFFFITFPAGLTLYWFVNNLFSIAQQYVVNKKFEAIRAEKKATESKK